MARILRSLLLIGVITTLFNGALSQAQDDEKWDFVELPFTSQDFAVDSESKFALLWGDLDSAIWRLGEASKTKRLAVLDLELKKIIEDRDDLHVNVGSIGSGYVAVSGDLNGDNDNCMLLRQSGLEIERSLRSTANFNRVHIGNGKFFFHLSDNQVDIFDLTDLSKKPRPLPNFGEHDPKYELTTEGPFYGGILYTADAKAKLLTSISQSKVPNDQKPSAGSELLGKSQLRVENRSGMTRFPVEGLQTDGLRRIGDENIPGLNSRAVLDLVVQDDLTVRLTFAGPEEIHHRIWRDQKEERSRPGNILNTLSRITRDFAFVLHGKRLFKIPLPSPAKYEDRNLIVPTFAAEQSHFTLAEGATTVLKHHLLGGKAPITFDIPTQYDWLTLDPVTGTLTIDNAKAMAYAKAVLLDQSKRGFQRHFYRSNAEYQTHVIKPLGELIGREIKHTPFALFIGLTATDDALRTTSHGYQLILDVNER